MPKDRGAEQEDVDGPLESSVALGMVAAQARLHVAIQQAARTPSWIGTNGPVDEQRLQAEQNDKRQRIQTFSSEAQENSSESTTRDMLCRKTEAKETRGALTTGTSYVT